jgi:hypothetical protein
VIVLDDQLSISTAKSTLEVLLLRQLDDEHFNEWSSPLKPSKALRQENREAIDSRESSSSPNHSGLCGIASRLILNKRVLQT